MSKDGLCAIVTGSASGLGAATAAILAKGGARIVVNYSNSKAEAEATADLLPSQAALRAALVRAMAFPHHKAQEKVEKRSRKDRT